MKNYQYKIRKNVVFSGLSFIVNILLVFLSFKLAMRYGGVEALGLWSTIYAWTALVRIGDVGMANSIIRFIAKCEFNLENKIIIGYIDTAVVVNIVIFMALTILAYITISFNMHKWLKQRDYAVAKEIIPYLMISIVLSNVSAVVMGGLSGIHKSWVAANIGVAGAVLQLIVIICTVPYFGIIGLAWAQIAQYGVSLSIGWILLRRYIGASLIPREISYKKCKEIMTFSVKMQISNTVNGFFEPATKIIIGNNFGMHAVGLYEIAFKTVTVPRGALATAAMAAVPSATHMAESDPVEHKLLFYKTEKYMLWAAVLFSIGVIIVSPGASEIWLGKMDWDFCIAVALISIGYLFNMAAIPAYNLSIIYGKVGGNLLSSCVMLVMAFVGGYVISSYASLLWVVAFFGFVLGFGALVTRSVNIKLLPGNFI